LRICATARRWLGRAWQGGDGKLLVVSVGTGTHRHRMSEADTANRSATGLAIRAQGGLMADTDALGITLLQWLSGSPSRWPLNTELGTLAGQAPPLGVPLLNYRRYDVHLEADWLERELGIVADEAELRRLRRMDTPDTVPRLSELGAAAARRFVKDADFPTAFDIPLVGEGA
jgi:hypothetical protein